MSVWEEVRQRPEESEADYKARLKAWEDQPATPYLESVAVSRALRGLRKPRRPLEKAKRAVRALSARDLQAFTVWLTGERK
jgi:hypothetical protein